MKEKIIKAYSLAMNGYSIEDITSSIMLIYKMHYLNAKKIAEKGYFMTQQFNEN